MASRILLSPAQVHQNPKLGINLQCDCVLLSNRWPYHQVREAPGYENTFSNFNINDPTIRDDIHEKKYYFKWALPVWGGGGRPLPVCFGPFFAKY